jgi:hypothetical protein
MRVIFATNDETDEEGRAAAVDAMLLRLTLSGMGGAEHGHIYWIRHDELVVEFSMSMADDAELKAAFLGSDDHPYLLPEMTLPYAFFTIYMDTFVAEAMEVMEANAVTTDRPAVLDEPDEPAAPPVVLSPGGYAISSPSADGFVRRRPEWPESAVGFDYEIVLEVRDGASAMSGARLSSVADEMSDLLSSASEIMEYYVHVSGDSIMLELRVMATGEGVVGFLQHELPSYQLSVVSSRRPDLDDFDLDEFLRQLESRSGN